MSTGERKSNMKEQKIEEFIKENTDGTNLCYYYSEYSEEVQESIKNVYAACFRFGLYKSQILYMLDEALRPYERNKDLFDLLGD
jgi:hypothetical protein